MARLLVFSTWRLAIMQRLVDSVDTVLSAIAAKAVKELTYHRDYAGRWFLTLAQGTEESRRRLLAALDARVAVPRRARPGPRGRAHCRRAGVGVDPRAVADEVDVVLEQVFSVSGVERPDRPALAAVRGRTGRDGLHTEALSRMLAEMQVVARAHPMGQW